MKIVSLSELAEESVSHNPEIKKKVMLRQGDLPHITNFSQAVFAPGQTAVPHSHPDMAEVFLVESGSGIITIDGAAYPLEPGICVTVQPNEQHELSNTGAAPLILTYFGVIV
ncbi:MAG TPA: cupin domain-containing protein [Anaerolineae bacterium]|nr:cupin domain-containing protein [Anaerolineae bacterium]HIP72410.1 cupin domain-containing protein [Anaerolineae bacterium]